VESGEPVRITKRGKPVAKLIAARKISDEIFGYMTGKAKIVGDIIHSAPCGGLEVQMILLDTHALLWMSVDPKKLSKKARVTILDARANDGIAVASITLWESLPPNVSCGVPRSIALLREKSASDAVVGQAIVDLGGKGAADGLEANDKGHIFAGDFERDSIRQRQTHEERKMSHEDNRLSWPDRQTERRASYDAELEHNNCDHANFEESHGRMRGFYCANNRYRVAPTSPTSLFSLTHTPCRPKISAG
jgi:hypothetical protein